MRDLFPINHIGGLPSDVVTGDSFLDHAWVLLAINLDGKGVARAFMEIEVRRAISAAYYGLFHSLAEDGAVQAVSSEHPFLRARVQRAFDHGQMKRVCIAVRDWKPASSQSAWPSLFDDEPHPHLRFVAASFVELQEARHLADYDCSREIPWTEGARFVGMASTARRQWRELRENRDAAVFMTALLLDTRLNRHG